MTWYWWFDSRDNTWHAWQGTPPSDGTPSACTGRSFDHTQDSQTGTNAQQGRCPVCRNVIVQ